MLCFTHRPIYPNQHLYRFPYQDDSDVVIVAVSVAAVFAVGVEIAAAAAVHEPPIEMATGTKAYRCCYMQAPAVAVGKRRAAIFAGAEVYLPMAVAVAVAVVSAFAVAAAAEGTRYRAFVAVAVAVDSGSYRTVSYLWWPQFRSIAFRRNLVVSGTAVANAVAAEAVCGLRYVVDLEDRSQ